MCSSHALPVYILTTNGQALLVVNQEDRYIWFLLPGLPFFFFFPFSKMLFPLLCVWKSHLQLLMVWKVFGFHYGNAIAF